MGTRMERHTTTTPAKKSLLSDESGVAMVEYVTLLCLVTLIGAVAVASLGVPLIQLFRFAQTILALPLP